MDLRARMLYRGGGTAASRWDVVAGRRVHSRVVAAPAGSHEVVFVHGLGVSSRYLMPTAVRLAPQYAALAPDLPGFGRTPQWSERRSVRGLAATLADWLDAVGLVRPSLVANSFGCQIAVELAVARPERVAALVLVGPTVDMYARSLPRQFARLVLDSVREPPGLLALIVLDYSIFVLRRGAPLVRAMLSDRLEENLPHVLQPTLVVRGSRDAIVSQPWAEKASALLPHGEMCVVDGAAHAVNYADPDALARVVCAFLGRAREP